PSQPYSFAEWRLRRVGVDYHVEVEAHFYSVPYRFARREVEVRLTPRTVEVFFRGERMKVLTHPMLDQLAKLGLSGMGQAFAELEAAGEGATLTHADWLGLLVDREMTHRRDKRLAARRRYARLRHHAVVEDVDYRAPCGLDCALFLKLAGGEWIDAHDNL